LPLFEWLEGRASSAVTSTITLTELLVHPYRAGDIDQVNTVYSLVTTYPHLEWQPATLAIADEAARLRATYRLKTPDAIQVATALVTGATGVVANDVAFRRVPEIEVFLLGGGR
jgi:predicted nucleic acid-binding protein